MYAIRSYYELRKIRNAGTKKDLAASDKMPERPDPLAERLDVRVVFVDVIPRDPNPEVVDVPLGHADRFADSHDADERFEAGLV